MKLVTRYHPMLVVLHWISAFLIIAALVLGSVVMVKIPNSDPMKFEALRSHMLGGMAIVFLMVIRLIIRSRTQHPAAASTGSPGLDRLAKISHRVLYIAVLGMGLSGLMMAWQVGLPQILFAGGNLPVDFWVYPIRNVHYVISRLLMVWIALHIAGAIYHIFILRDGLLGRMFFGRRIVANSVSEAAHRQSVQESAS
jgi:cytochrome b561